MSQLAQDAKIKRAADEAPTWIAWVRWAWVPFAFGLVYLWPQIFSDNRFYLQLAAEAGIIIILTSALNLALGYTDLVSMAHSGLYAIGAYTTGLLVARLKVPFLWSLPLAFLVAGLLGALVTLATLRAAHLYFAMITLSFNLILVQIALAWTAVTNGEDGIAVTSRPTLLTDQKLDQTQYFYFIWVVVALAVWLIRNLVRSKYGRAFLAIRGDEETAATLGVAVFRYKLLSFTLSAGFAGLAGALYAPLKGFVNPSLAALDSTLKVFVGLLIGGAATIVGPILGVVFAFTLDRLLVIGTDWINSTTRTSSATAYQVLAYGILLLFTMVVIPRGIIGTWLGTRPGRYLQNLFQPKVRLPESEAERAELLRPILHPQDARHLSNAPDRAGPILRVSDLSKYFGGLKALNGVNMQVGYGQIHGLIGPNGSGKSTSVNVISGYLARSGGTLEYGGQTVNRPRPYLLARRGIVRIFQATRLFGEMTVLDNLLVGLHLSSRQNFLTALLHLPPQWGDERVLRQRALVLLEQVGLAERAYEPATALSHGQRRLLEVARALAVGPALLILDEPATGLTAEELRGLSALVARLKEGGIAVLLIEHNMDFLMRLADTVTVYDFGTKIAEGKPEEVQNNPQVITAYLGADDEEDYEAASADDIAAWGQVGASLGEPDLSRRAGEG